MKNGLCAFLPKRNNPQSFIRYGDEVLGIYNITWNRIFSKTVSPQTDALFHAKNADGIQQAQHGYAGIGEHSNPHIRKAEQAHEHDDQLDRQRNACQQIQSLWDHSNHGSYHGKNAALEGCAGEHILLRKQENTYALASSVNSEI